MHRFVTTLGATAVAFLAAGLLLAPIPPLAKEPPVLPGISPEKVADYVHAIIQAD